jgi:LmbE family N-acetylglucosaminyl deacetylase
VSANSEQVRVLVVAAHPDDEVLGCGGTIARRAAEGDNVVIAILGEGMTSRYEEREVTDRSAVDALHTAAREAGALLGADDVLLEGLPDNRFDSLPLLEVVKVVERLVERTQPHVIYTHHGGDLNVDHVVTHRAVLIATRPQAGRQVAELLAFEVASSTEWAFGQFAPVFRPNVFVEIVDTIQAKLAAMQRYESEARPFPHPRSPEALEALARFRGAAAGLEAAEAFELVRRIAAVRPPGR